MSGQMWMGTVFLGAIPIKGEEMKSNICLSLNIAFGIIGMFLGLVGECGEWAGKCMKNSAVAIIEYSFRFDDF
jgi:hypothetical protein